ncbi:MAG: hypothetical protein WD625_03470 [Balneolales bacterium]
MVTILVGIATVVAMNVFGTASADANRNAVRQDLLQGATAAQAIWARPAMLDGAGQDFILKVYLMMKYLDCLECHLNLQLQ